MSILTVAESSQDSLTRDNTGCTVSWSAHLKVVQLPSSTLFFLKKTSVLMKINSHGWLKTALNYYTDYSVFLLFYGNTFKLSSTGAAAHVCLLTFSLHMRRLHSYT